MAPQFPDIHFLLVPFMSQSHLLPFTDMAKLLAKRDVRVTIVMTPLNASRYKNVLDQAKASNLKIHFVTFRFPCKENGLPEGCENMDSIPSPDHIAQFFDASNMLQQPLEEWLCNVDTKSRPNCMISDICLPWTSDVALKYNMPRLLFHGISCFTLLCSHNIKAYKAYDGVQSDTEKFLVPHLPDDDIYFTKDQLPEVVNENSQDDMEDLLDQFKQAELSADGVMVNSFEELERDYARGYRKQAKNLWCIGPVSLANNTTRALFPPRGVGYTDPVNSTKFDRGNKSSVDESHCLTWLDSRSPNSVLYVCFGSLCHLLASQLIELAIGLEESNCSFIWVIRKGDYSEELDKWFLEYNFEEKIKGRGLLIRGWAPQVQILSHPAIMGFMTHCGWNSTLEAISLGVPMITWPMFAEQFYNEKLIVQVLKTGVRIGVEKCVKWGEEEKIGVLVKRGDVKKAIEKFVDCGDEGQERRRRAKEFGDKARRAVEEGGSSYMSMNIIIQYVTQLLIDKCNISMEGDLVNLENEAPLNVTFGSNSKEQAVMI